MHVHQYVYILFVLPYYWYQVTFHLSLRSPFFNFILCQKFFSISFLFGLTVPQQFIVLVCKLSSNAADEEKLSFYNLCPTSSTLAVSPVTVACAAVMKASHISCLCLNTQSYCEYIPYSNMACRALSQTACVSLIYTVWRWLYLLSARLFHQSLNVKSQTVIFSI
jgi:hypothetical protein